MEAQQTIYEKIQFGCDTLVHWFGTEQEFRDRHELMSEEIYVQFQNILFLKHCNGLFKLTRVKGEQQFILFGLSMSRK